MRLDSTWNPLTLGTVVLAAATVVLAWATWRAASAAKRAASEATEATKATQRLADTTLAVARASEEEVQATRGVLEASIKPILVDVPRNLDGPVTELTFEDSATLNLGAGAIAAPTETDRFAYFSVPFRNIGPGVAFIRGLGLEFPGRTGWSGKMSASVVGPGDTTRLSFSIPKDRPELAEGLDQLRGGNVSVLVSYTDVHGGQMTMTRVALLADGTGPGKWDRP
jgi:hypothetical protein